MKFALGALIGGTLVSGIAAILAVATAGVQASEAPGAGALQAAAPRAAVD